MGNCVHAESIPDAVYWGLCPADSGIPVQPVAAPNLETGSISIDADEADLIEGGVSRFNGNVEVVRDSNAIRSDSLEYNNDIDQLTAEGNIDFWSDAMYWHGDRMQFQLEAQTGRLEDGSYALQRGRGHGKADVADINTATHFNSFTDVFYTTCSGDVPDWKLAAKSIELDNNNDVGVARHVTLQLRNVPIMYLPYISFPLTDHRKTGFLFPYFGSSSDSGVDVSLPFYWNIAPNYDATITPRVIGGRGSMLKGEFRYLHASNQGQLDFEYLPSDDDFGDEDRSLFSLFHHYNFDRGYATVNYKKVSDKEYFEDFGRSLSVSSVRFLEQTAIASYAGDYWTLTGRLQNYQLVDKTITSRPYKRLPQLNLFSRLPQENQHLNFQFKGEAVYFDIDQDPTSPTPNLVGGRIDVQPSITYPLVTTAGFIKPKLSLKHTSYLLDKTANRFDSNESRTLPVFSVDSGAFFERDMALGSSKYLQTLEPRVYYLYIPEQEQDDIPIFDTGEYDISFAQLFREDRFSGPDRVGDANQVSVALTSRLINHETGQERLRASIGEIFYIQDREVTLPGVADKDDNTSELIAEVAGRIGKHWIASANMQWNPNNNETDKGAIRLRYRPGNGRTFNAGYRYRQGSTAVEQTDVSFQWPLNPHWSVVGRWNYSVKENDHLETVAGLEYNSCCWGARFVARRYLTDTSGTHDNAFFMQIELKGLAGMGRRTKSYLQEQIPGYSSDF